MHIACAHNVCVIAVRHRSVLRVRLAETGQRRSTRAHLLPLCGHEHNGSHSLGALRWQRGHHAVDRTTIGTERARGSDTKNGEMVMRLMFVLLGSVLPKVTNSIMSAIAPASYYKLPCTIDRYEKSYNRHIRYIVQNTHMQYVAQCSAWLWCSGAYHEVKTSNSLIYQ